MERSPSRRTQGKQQPMRNKSIWALVILLAGFAARLFRLGAASLWYDETVSLFLARQDLISLTRHTAGDIHPPLYYYLLHFWGQFAGWSEFSAAFVSLFFGVLLIALVYRVAREWLDVRNPFSTSPPGSRGSFRKLVSVGILAASLVAISPYNLWYSQEVRMYTLGAVLGLASVYFFVKMLSSDHRPATADRRVPIVTRYSSLIAYAVVSVLGLYTLYYFLFVIAFENLVALVWLASDFKSAIPTGRFAVRNRQSAILQWVSSQLAVVVLYLPWLPIAFRQATNPPVPPWRGFTPLGDVLVESFSALALGQSVDWHSPGVWGILLLVALIMVSSFNFQVTSKNPKLKTWNLKLLLLGYTFVPLLLIFVFSLWKPLYHVRYIFLYSPAFYIWLAFGLSQILDLRITSHASRIAFYVFRFSSYAVFLLLMVAGIYSAYNFWFEPRYASDDLRGAVKRLAAEWRPGDAILLDAGYTYTAFDYYYPQPVSWRGRLVDSVPRAEDAETGAIVLQTGSIGGDKNLGWGSPESDFYATTAEDTRAALDRVFATHPRVWLLRLYDTVVDPDGVIRDYLGTHGRIIDDQGFEGESFARVQGYITGAAAFPVSATSRRIVLGNRIALVGFEPNTVTVGAGDALGVNLYWQAQEPTNVDMHLFVGLFAENGEMVASGEDVPLGNAFGTSKWATGEMVREPVRLQSPRDVPPGNYVLRVALYNPLTNEPLVAENSPWVVEGGQIKLTTVYIRN